MTITGSLIDLLTERNPQLDLRSQPQGNVTKSNDYYYLHKDNILDWPDFTYEHISRAYGHLFSTGPLASAADPNLRGTPTEIEKEAHVDDLGLLWNYQICREPLKSGAESIQARLGLEAIPVTLKHLGRDSHDLGNDNRARAPDWSICMRDARATVLVWGDSKCSSKWASDKNAIPRKFRDNWTWPYRQLLTYCVNNATRYGFILTPEEIVAARITNDKSTPNKPWRVQAKAVPWGNHGPGRLTVNLTIWVLAMMSINEKHRPICSPEETLPVNVWWRDGAIYEHHLSGRREAQLLEGGEARPRPDAIPGTNGSSQEGQSPSPGSSRRAEGRKRQRRV